MKSSDSSGVDRAGCYVLAGGGSRRMGRDKALLDLGGKPIIARVIEGLEEVFPSVVVVAGRSTDRYAFLGRRTIPDLLEGKGSLGGIYTALQDSPFDYNFVVACDTPFINPTLIEFMLDFADGRSDIVVPLIDGLFYPLHAIYSRRCSPFIEDRLIGDDLKIISFFPKMRVKCISEDQVRRLDPRMLCFFNINTEADYEEARNIFSSSK
ncbi:MAG: molybdenum cofactor guanylyltransferase [bacterium]